MIMLFWRFLYWAVVALFIFAIMIAVIICSAAIYAVIRAAGRWWKQRGGKK